MPGEPPGLFLHETAPPGKKQCPQLYLSRASVAPLRSHLIYSFHIYLTSSNNPLNDRLVWKSAHLHVKSRAFLSDRRIFYVMQKFGIYQGKCSGQRVGIGIGFLKRRS